MQRILLWLGRHSGLATLVTLEVLVIALDLIVVRTSPEPTLVPLYVADLRSTSPNAGRPRS
jgi:hypothetical protein